METGLAYKEDAKVYIGETEVAAENYVIDKEGDKLETDTFSVSIDDDYIKTLAVGTVIITQSESKKGLITKVMVKDLPETETDITDINSW